MSTYLFDNAAPPAGERFTSLEHCYDKATTRNLETLGVSAGWRCLEVGGGGGSIAHWLAGRVGSTGRVIATDIDPTRMRPALGDVEIRRHDIVADDLEESYFDLVHARLVLLHLPQRRQVVERIFHALRPGGYLLLEEFDVTWSPPVLAAPGNGDAELFWKVVAGIHRLLVESGMDPEWARTAYSSLDEFGYTDLGFAGFCEPWRGGSAGARLHGANAAQIADRLCARGLVAESELDAFMALIKDPRFAVSSYLMLATWGRRPTDE